MKRNIYVIIFIIVSLILIAFPFVLDMLIQNGVIAFAPGAIDSWIDFLGSYIGAIIGASVVYFVALMQVKKQNEQQMVLLELRSKYELQREMRFFYSTKLMEKVEEFIAAIDQMIVHIPKIYEAMLNISLLMSEKNATNEHEVRAEIEMMKQETDHVVSDCKYLVAQIGDLAHYTDLFAEKDQVFNAMKTLINEYKQIEAHYETYVAIVRESDGPIQLQGVAQEAYETINGLSQSLKDLLTNIQKSLTVMTESDAALQGKGGEDVAQ